MLWQPLLTPHSRVFSWPTLRVTTRIHKQPSSLRQLIVYRLPETTQHRASTNIQHTSLTTLERRYDPFVIHDSNQRQHDMTGLSPRVSQLQPVDNSTLHLEIIFHVPNNRRQHTTSIPGAVFDPRSKQSTTADNPRLPSNRREHKVFSKQSTTAQSLRLPSNRREHKVFAFQAIDERSSTNTLNDEQLLVQVQRDKDNWPRAQLTTHSPTTPTSSAGARSCAHIARTHAPHTHHTNTNYKKTVCQCHERIHCLCSMETKKKKKRKRKKKHTLTIQTQTTQNEKTYECHVWTQEKKYLVCLQVQCLS